MSTDEYVPSECEVRADFVWTHTRNFDSYLMGRSLTSEQEHYGAQFDAMIARVRRDAAREALDGLVRQEEEAFLRLHVNDAPISAAAAQYARSAAEAYKHEHYPEEATP